jgi:hypothetical protein
MLKTKNTSSLVNLATTRIAFVYGTSSVSSST